MMRQHLRFTHLLLGIALAQGGLLTNAWLGTKPAIAGPASPSAIGNARWQSQPEFESRSDFDEDDEFEQAGDGLHAIYVDRYGTVLGTFVNVPGAKIKVYASGEIAIAEQDYTEEIEYYTSGRIRSIGNAKFDYFSSGRIHEIDGIEFSYFSSGRLSEIENVEFSYFNSGRVHEIENVEFTYRSDGTVDTISASQTRNGIRIVIVE